MNWKQEIEKALRNSRRVVVFGLGNEWMGDDGVGSLIAKELNAVSAGGGFRKELKAIAGGGSPENFTGLIRKESPEWILIIDAADMQRPPGEIALLSPQEMNCLVHSTHTIPISLLTEYLESTTGAKVAALGIQPKTIEFGVPLSKEVSSSIQEVVHVLKAAL